MRSYEAYGFTPRRPIILIMIAFRLLLSGGMWYKRIMFDCVR